MKKTPVAEGTPFIPIRESLSSFLSSPDFQETLLKLSNPSATIIGNLVWIRGGAAHLFIQTNSLPNETSLN